MDTESTRPRTRKSPSSKKKQSPQPAASESRSASEAVAATLDCFDPATRAALGTVEVMDAAAVGELVARASAAQPAWAATSFAERRAVMRDLLDAIVAQQARICELCARDSGKTLVDAALGEIFPVCEKLRYLIGSGERDLRPERRPSGFLMHKAARVEYEPLGVVGVIAPWNFPFHNIYCPIVPALFAGNAVVVKVSEWTSWSAPALVAVVRDVLAARGHSPELVQLAIGDGRTGEALVRSGVAKIFFTGSPQNGKKVMAAASDTLTPVVLELGGKDPMIVLEDADLDHAVEQAMLGVYTACGQMCVGAERVLVHESVYATFVERVVERVSRLRQGAPLEAPPGSVDVGAMTMPGQLDILESLVDDAVARGARLLVGGHRRDELGGQFFAPTVLADVTPEMRIAREEQFGPVMVLFRVRDDEDAVRIANDCPYGLGSSVFTRDRARAEAIARRLQAGMTVVNDYGLAYMIQSLPFGGTKLSGFGRINGREGLRACCNVKAVVTDRVSLGGGVSVYPLTASTFGLVEGAIGVIYGRGVLGRGRAAVNAVRSLVEVARARAAFRRGG